MKFDINQPRVANITFGYSDSEDRIWVRILLTNDSEAKFWLTRRLCESLINALAKLLEEHSPLKNVFSKNELTTLLHQEYQDINANSDTPPPPPKNLPHQMAPLGICHTIDITPGNPWLFVWNISNNKQYALLSDRPMCLRLLRTIQTQSERAKWCICSSIKWLNSSEL